MIGTFLKIYEHDSSYTIVEAAEEPRVNAAVEKWIASGCTTDTLLDLTCVDGDDFCIKASAIVSWLLSTPEGRRRRVEWEASVKEESREYKQATGDWDEES